jgi:hypothetical protein
MLLFQENFPVRGFQSGMDQQLLFGLGSAADSILDKVHVFWPDGKYQNLTNVSIGKPIVLLERSATDKQTIKTYLQKQKSTTPLFSPIIPEGINWQHQENTYSDFNVERLMPHLLSTQGPALAVADVDKNGLDDVFFGGAAKQSGVLYMQIKPGSFLPTSLRTFAIERQHEDVDATFFDADNDGDEDLIVASAGNQLGRGSEYLLDRLYLNNGNGIFKLAENALPPLKENTSVIRPTDFDADGDMDLFIGVRNIPGAYGLPAPAYLLENNGKGQFIDVTKAIAADLASAGMLTGAVWLPNEAGYPDLVISGEWMPIKYFKNTKGKFTLKQNIGFEDAGWWQSLTAADIDNDGDTDLIAGNLGENTFLHATPDEPMQLIVKDFDNSGNTDPIIGMYHKSIDGERKLFPLYGRDTFVEQMSYIRKAYPTYTDFAGKTLNEIFPISAGDSTQVSTISELASIAYINDGNNNFKKLKLPLQVQFSPLLTALQADFNTDGNPDLLTAGNLFGVNPHLGQYDAGIGTLLLGNEQGTLAVLPNSQHGLWLSGEVRKTAIINIGKQTVLVVLTNNQKPLFFKIADEQTAQ